MARKNVVHRGMMMVPGTTSTMSHRANNIVSSSTTSVRWHMGHHTPDRADLAPRSDDSRRGVALIVGAGDALGSALAHKFARQGLVVAVVRRNADKLYTLKMEIENNSQQQHAHDPRDGSPVALRCEIFPADARKEDQLVQVVERIENTLGPIEVAVHNIGANVKLSILDPAMTANKYFKVWEMAALSAFLMGQAVAIKMQPRQRGTIIFTGATASLRGNSHFAAFAGAMAAKRALAQSLARELGPQGIHVAHVIIDGGIQTEFVQQILGEERYQQAIDQEGLLDPVAIAENYWNLHQQPRVAWTHELDLRPWIEKW
jgi:NAD(P)-dependent dehydrogenase (short-subunit alcohol dehydrogenase family)